MLWIAKNLDVDVHELTTRKAETDVPIKRLAPCWPVTQAHTARAQCDLHYVPI